MEIRERVQAYLRSKWDRTHVRVKRPYFLAVDALKGGLNYGASIVSVLTVGADPDSPILQRMTHGPVQSAIGLYRLAEAYATNMGIRDFTTGAAAEGGKVFVHGLENIARHPLETAIVALGTYATLKLGRRLIDAVENQRIDRHVERMRGKSLAGN